jgi:archaellum biogenesis ATPase FlaH
MLRAGKAGPPKPIDNTDKQQELVDTINTNKTDLKLISTTKTSEKQPDKVVLSKAVAEYQEKAKQDAELLRKEKELKIHRVNKEHSALKNYELTAKRTTSVSDWPEGSMEALAARDDYFWDNISKALVFINDSFSKVVPFMCQNVILLAGRTGGGKSTASANIVYSTIKQGKRVLYLTNEEFPEDILNRVSCIQEGWEYADRLNFSPEQKEKMRKYREILKPMVLVADDTYDGILNATTSVEGIQVILNSIKEEDNIGVIILDYIQNVYKTAENTRSSAYEVQKNFCHFLDQYKANCTCPIVVLSQLHDTGKNRESLLQRIITCKDIYIKSTFAMEILVDTEALETAFYIHKGRFSKFLGKTITCKFNRGKLDPLRDNLRESAQRESSQKAVEEIMNNKESKND